MFEEEAKEYGDNYVKSKYMETVDETWQKGAEFGYNKVKKELEEERKLNAEIKARFVKCNTCTDEMKSKCLMFTENLCEGERCEELIDIVSLVNKSDLERKIEALEKANEWHYPSKGELPENNKLCLIQMKTGTFEIAYRVTDLCWKYKNTTFSCSFQNEIYAWKEIVLPELPKESK